MTPLVSAIMPTRGRPQWAKQAVESFAVQTYPKRELIIIDDINERSFPNGGIEIPRCNSLVIYLLHKSRSIAEKRNLCCSYAKGDLICHWDSDDHSEPARIQSQVDFIERSEASVIGCHSMLFHMEQGDCWFKYCGYGDYAIGTSLMYRKSWWTDHPFRDGGPGYQANVGEDSEFVKAAQRLGQLATVDADTLMYARIHATNTSIKAIDGAQVAYRPVSLEAIPKHFR